MLYHSRKKKSLCPLLLLCPEQVYVSPTGISTEVSRKEHQCRLSKCLELFSWRGTGLLGTAGSLGGKTNFLVLKVIGFGIFFLRNSFPFDSAMLGAVH